MKAHPLIRHLSVLFACALTGAGAHAAAKELPPKPSVGDIVKTAQPADWRPLDPDNTLYMELPKGRVVIELAPAFAPHHAANIKALVARPLLRRPGGVARAGQLRGPVGRSGRGQRARAQGRRRRSPPCKPNSPRRWPPRRTSPACPTATATRPRSGHVDGFPAGRDPKAGRTWLAHCYGMVGVGPRQRCRQRRRHLACTP